MVTNNAISPSANPTIVVQKSSVKQPVRKIDNPAKPVTSSTNPPPTMSRKYTIICVIIPINYTPFKY